MMSYKKFDYKVNKYIEANPELKNHREWEPIDSENVVPVFKGKFNIKNTTPVSNIIFDNVGYYDCLQCPLLVLLYLLKHRNWEGKGGDKHRTVENWRYRQGLLVASRSQGRMAKDLKMPTRTLQRWLKNLEDDGLIRIVKEGRENIYVIGEIVDGVEEYFYAKKYPKINMSDYLL